MANEIQELKFQVGEAWKGVYSPSTAYGLANVVQDPTGLSIYRSLKSGNVGHPLSNASWWFRIIDLSSIKAESDRIAALNQAIAQDEALRVAAEELRQQHEAERVAAETQRNEAEQQRISAEEQRVNKESQREAAEQQRITAEQGRVSAESARVQAEQARVLAETLRANAEDQRAANEQNRVAAEQQRIERAEQDHQRAESDHATYVDSLGAFDISSYHATDGVLAKYADLTAALGTGGANIPDDLRKGGMSVKFVQSSDNKYIQARCMAQSFTTDVTQWQGIDDEPTDGSKNIVESGGVNKAIEVGREQSVSIINNEYVTDRGAFARYTGWSRTGYLYLGNLDTLAYNNSGPQSSYCAFYDEYKQFISRFTIANGNGEVSIPDNAVWCALSNATEGMSQLTLTNIPIKISGIIDLERKTKVLENIDEEPTPESGNLVTSGGITDVYGKYVDSENVPLLKYQDKDNKEFFRFEENGSPVFLKNEMFGIEDKSNDTTLLSFKDVRGFNVDKLDSKGCRVHGNILDVFNNVSVKELDIRSYNGTLKLGSKLGKLTDIFTFNPYYKYLQYVLQLRRPHSEYPQLEQESLVLCWFSDLHGAADNFSRIIQLKNAFRKYIDDTILTGDIVMAQYPDSIDFIKKYNAEDVLLVIGNHDVWRQNQAPVENMPEIDVYNKFFKPYISNWNVTQPNNADNGKCYYYKDYEANNIRLVVINCMHDTEAQRTWFTDTLSDAKTKGLHVICSSHYPVDSAVITADNNKVLTDNTFQAYDERYNLFETSSMSRFCATEIDNFINNEGNFVCWICGHMHSDYFGLCANHHNQLMIGVENAGHHKDGNDSDRVTGTKTQDSFNLISFDVSKKFIRIVRVGNDFDRLLRHKEAITYNYESKRIISNY